MDCCGACTSVFNCVWWKFDFSTAGDGWQPGTCHYAYYTGKGGDIDSEQPQICPNGVTQGILDSSSTGTIGLESNNDEPGYNFGPCVNGDGNFESSLDFGFPDDYNEVACQFQQIESSPPGCA